MLRQVRWISGYWYASSYCAHRGLLWVHPNAMSLTVSTWPCVLNLTSWDRPSLSLIVHVLTYHTVLGGVPVVALASV